MQSISITVVLLAICHLSNRWDLRRGTSDSTLSKALLFITALSAILSSSEIGILLVDHLPALKLVDKETSAVISTLVLTPLIIFTLFPKPVNEQNS